MRYTRLVLLSTLSAFALLTASTTSRAFAPSVTDMGLLRPHDVWQVGSVTAQNASYCAMVNQFDKEISLAFARNSAGYGSLAINFPGGILDTGMTYQVMLQMDDQEARQFNVRAASPRSIIVQIGQDEDFYSSLASNGTLHISLPTIDMKFDFKKFSNSYISLVTCADKLPHHEGPRTAALPVPPVEKLPLTETKAVVAVAASESATAPLSLTPQKPSAAEKISSAAPVHGPDIAAIAAETKEQDKRLREQKDFVNKLTGENTNINEENFELKRKLAQSSADQSELKNEISLVKAEKDGLQDKLDMQARQSKLLEAALNGKEKDLLSVRSVSVQDGKSLADVEAELNNLKRDHSAVVADLQTKLAEETAHYDILQKQFTDIKNVGRSTESQASQSQAELDLSRQHLAQVLAQLAAAEQQRNEQAAQIEAQNQQNKTLFAQMKQELEKARGQVSMLQSQMMSVTMQRDDLASQLSSQVKQNKTLRVGLEMKEKELSSSLTGQNMMADYTTTTELSEQNTGSEYTAAAAPSETGAQAFIPPAFPDVPLSAARTGGRNFSSSESGRLPAITPQVIGQNASSFPPALKTSAAGAEGSSSPTDENWETVVVQ